MMFRRANKRIVELSTREVKLLRTALMHFRNKVLKAGKPTEDIESLLGVRAYLDLWVKVKENWRDRPALLSDFGYKEEDLK